MISILTRLSLLEKKVAELATLNNRTGLFLGKPRDVTIAGGSVDVAGNFLLLTPEVGNTDDLDTIVDAIEAKTIFLQCADAAYTITVKDGTGNIILPSGDVSLVGETQILSLVYDESQSAWLTFLPVV